jgi:hypothetical protein
MQDVHVQLNPGCYGKINIQQEEDFLFTMKLNLRNQQCATFGASR